MRITLIILCAVIFIFAVLFVIFSFVAMKFFGRGEPYDVSIKLKNEPELLERVLEGRRLIASHSYSDVSITSFDGLRLDGRLYTENTDSKKFVICFHGYHSIGHNDFAGAVDFFLKNGFNVLLAVQRNHGTSEGKYLTFGVKEKYDCVAWAKYLSEMYDNGIDIILDGVSMGAATVTMASDKSLGLPDTVKAILADCGYTSPWDIVCHVAKKDYRIPVFPFVYILRLTTKLICGFDLKGDSSVEAVKNAALPIFFAHGEGDDFVPYRMVHEIADNCASDHTVFSVPGAGHGLSFIVDEEGYKNALFDFLGKYINI